MESVGEAVWIEAVLCHVIVCWDYLCEEMPTKLVCYALFLEHHYRRVGRPAELVCKRRGDGEGAECRQSDLL